MKRLLLLIALVSMFGVTTVHAQPEPPPPTEPALLFHKGDEGFFCFGAAPDPTAQDPPNTGPLPGLRWIFLPGTLGVETNSRNGNSEVTCHGDLPENLTPPARTMISNYKNTGFPCVDPFMPDIASTNWRQVITPSGQVMLTCNFNPQSTIPWPPP